MLRVDELFGVRGCCVFRVSQGCRIVREPLQKSIGSLVLQGQSAANKERDGENRARLQHSEVGRYLRPQILSCVRWFAEGQCSVFANPVLANRPNGFTKHQLAHGH